MASVSDYAPTSDYEKLQYPFDRPRASFYTDGLNVTEMPNEFAAFWEQTNSMLVQANLPTLEQRIPVVAYGANSNPYKLGEKMRASGNEEIASELQTVPNILATLPDTVVAWHGKPGQTGSTFAELYTGEDTKGRSSEVHIQFLSPIQVALMHASEGVTYHFVQLNAEVGNDKQPMPVFAYVAGKSEVLLKDDQAVPVKRAGELAEFDDAMSAEEAVNYMLQHAKEVVGNKTARQLVDEMNGLTLKEKKAKQATIRDHLGKIGLSKQFSFPAENGYYLRGDFNFKGSDTFQMLEQVLEPLRPKDPKLRNTKDDIAVKMRKRAHEELFA